MLQIDKIETLNDMIDPSYVRTTDTRSVAAK